MEYTEIERGASDHLDRHFISVWEKCDALVSEGIGEVRDRWANYSVHSHRKDPRNHLKDAHADIKKEKDKRPIGELILEALDPKVSAFLNSLSETHLYFFPTPYLNIDHSLLQASKAELSIPEKTARERTIKFGRKFKAETPLTNLVMMMGFKDTHDAIKQQLRHFLKTEHQCRPIDFRFQATVDNLLELLWMLHQTPTRFKHHSPDIKINARRKQTYCELCGQRNELAEHLHRLDNNLLDPDDQQDADDKQEATDKQKKKLQLSHRYCARHRPRNKDGRIWNPVYKSALQSKEQFEKELQRLKLHVAGAVEYKPVLDDTELRSLSAEELIDRYFYLFLEGKTVTKERAQAYFDYVKDNFKFPIELEGETKRLIDEAAVRLTGAGTLLGADDEGKLRDIARHMVDSRLTDRKKQILVLKKQGLNQTQISKRLTELEGRTISPQAVSRALNLIECYFKNS